MTAQLACMTADVPVGTAMRVELDGADGAPVEVAVVRDADGDFHAISDICSHGQVSLSDGEVDGCTIECWLHGSTFDLRTGKPLALPATKPVPVYPVTLDGDRVLVDVDVTIA
ncbi:non-heme iron oxygenase ferredoxin subunit [Actinotalea fermentans]|uniref:(2Fe-2S)-binding protein n=1 Tax=Actinotalea fermentans TaxID=43671 RepID=A0A511YVC8_9CELL|nr:non-heme iron oxygenase ferredoxin subunit [Actinotalea fermentans]KGM17097.1 (2Fe-2S)-binding protein [Actinotalea fermentans ATCC 43279 = JCM 9966 = DSM 3133]GEN79164.1 (2Fe-2S)-binding protein [Actinotalea fermentans]